MRSFVLLAAAALATAQSADAPLFGQKFDKDTGGWIAFGAGASVHPADGVLAIEYEIQAGRITGAVLPAPAAFARMGRLRFRARSDHAGPLGVVLAEKMPGGGRYTAWVWMPAGAWQDVELGPRDFVANDGPKDPVDADGRLDLDAIENVALLDLAQFFGAAADPGAPVAVDRAAGKHILRIDDFELLAGAPPEEAPGTIDRFRRSALQWVSPGGMELRRVAESPMGGPAMEVSYEPADDRFSVLVRRLGAADLSHAARLQFDIASEKETTLAVALEMQKPGAANGPRFHMTIFPPGDREVFHVSLKLADFEGPGKLDAAQLKTLSLADVSAVAGGAVGRNTLWIANVRMVPE